jgi:MFS family permease
VAHDPYRLWLAVLTVASANALPAMLVLTLGIVLPEVRVSLRLSEVEAGTLFSLIFIAAAAASVAAGRLADRAGRFGTLLIGLVLLAAPILLAVTDSYLAALGLLGLAGIGYGFVNIALYALLSDLLPARRGVGTGLVSVAYGAGAFVGPLFAGAVTAAAGWRAAFVAVGVVALAMAGVQALCRRMVEALCVGRSMATRPAFGLSFTGSVNRDVALVTAGSVFGGVLFWGTSSWAPTVLRADKALTLGEAAIVMAAWGVTPMVGSILVGLLSDRLGRKRVMLWIALPGAIAVVGIFTLLHSVTALTLGFALLGLIRSPVPSQVVALGQDSAEDRAAGTASGLVMSGYYAAAVVVPLVTGALMAALRDGVRTMVIVLPVGLCVYSVLIAAVREKPRGWPV